MTKKLRPAPKDRVNRDRNRSSDACGRRCARPLASMIIAVLFGFVHAGDALAQRRMYDEWREGPSMMPWNMGWFGSLLMFALWVALFAAVFFLIKNWIQASRKEERHLPPRPSAMEILKERYARGEIDKEEFEEKRRVLEESG